MQCFLCLSLIDPLGDHRSEVRTPRGNTQKILNHINFLGESRDYLTCKKCSHDVVGLEIFENNHNHGACLICDKEPDWIEKINGWPIDVFWSIGAYWFSCEIFFCHKHCFDINQLVKN